MNQLTAGTNNNEEQTFPIRIIRSLEELEKYQDGWNTLALQAPQRSPMNSWAWLSAYFEKRLEKPERWYCVIAGTADNLLGVLPVIVSPGKLLGKPAPILRTPGDHHTIAVDLVVDTECAEQVIPQLIDAALAEQPSYQYFEFSQLVEQSPTLHWFRKNITRIRMFAEHIGDGAYLKTETSFDAFRSKLSSNFRSNLNKAHNKLKKLSDVEVEFKSGRVADDSDLLHMAAVEDKSWKGKAGTSILKSQSLIDFYSVVCRRLSKTGWLEWHFLNAENKTIAANLAINFAGSIVVWKLGYDEAFNRYSPGSILFERLVQRACKSDEIDEINLMTDMPWYDNWNMERRKYFQVRIYSLRPIPFLFALIPIKLKNILRRFRLIRWFYAVLKKI